MYNKKHITNLDHLWCFKINLPINATVGFVAITEKCWETMTTMDIVKWKKWKDNPTLNRWLLVAFCIFWTYVFCKILRPSFEFQFPSKNGLNSGTQKSFKFWWFSHPVSFQPIQKDKHHLPTPKFLPAFLSIRSRWTTWCLRFHRWVDFQLEIPRGFPRWKNKQLHIFRNTITPWKIDILNLEGHPIEKENLNQTSIF